MELRSVACVEQHIQELMESTIKPFAQSDGGDVEFERFDPETGVVYVSLHGACVSCASSTVTLKFMIRKLLMHELDEVTDVERVDDDDDDDLLATIP